MTDTIRLMIVDDHPVVRDGLSGMFAGEDGFEVVAEAANGADAVRRARALTPDVILMDLRMPELDGVAAITALIREGVSSTVLGVASRLMTQSLLISEATVKTHLLHIYAKLSVSDRAATVAEAFNRGLLTPREAGR